MFFRGPLFFFFNFIIFVLTLFMTRPFSSDHCANSLNASCRSSLLSDKRIMSSAYSHILTSSVCILCVTSWGSTLNIKGLIGSPCRTPFVYWILWECVSPSWILIVFSHKMQAINLNIWISSPSFGCRFSGTLLLFTSSIACLKLRMHGLWVLTWLCLRIGERVLLLGWLIFNIWRCSPPWISQS